MIVAINGHDQQQKNLVTFQHTQGDCCVVLWLIVVSAAIAVGLCVASAPQTFHRHNKYFAVIMPINGHDQQQRNLATMEYIQGDGCVVLWLIAVSVAIVVVLCVVFAFQTRKI